MSKDLDTTPSVLGAVIDNDVCNGCGNCSYLEGDVYSVALDSYGKYKSKISREERIDIGKACPFSGKSRDEDAIARDLYKRASYNGFIGYYRELYAGYVNSCELRSMSTSGGMIRWILTQLIQKDGIDGIIHVKKSQGNAGVHFEYGISRTIDEISSGVKSVYYPVSPSNVLNQLRGASGKYVFVGLPCMVKSLRLLCEEDQSLNLKIAYTIGLVCGHLKTKGYADYFASKLGFGPDYDFIDFRHKTDIGGASAYSVKVAKGEEIRTIESRKCKAANWQYNAYRYPCCNYCDDVFSETADITVGDAWIKPYIDMDQGVSEIIVRSQSLLDLLNQGKNENQVVLSQLTATEVIRSQLGGLRDRREGLAYRLWQDEQNNKWVPKKRIKPRDIRDKDRKKVYLLRRAIEKQSNFLYSSERDLSEADDMLSVFYNELDCVPRKNKVALAVSKLFFITSKDYKTKG
ncbi:Coenzyme F420 hydrogenase/dehydrogenase, beta subunit C-terminal domain [Ferrimonas balearica]|uniref:Coenzyme F420 hydrogenase/dehydrogenase, beta subunit C-terminal domain n=1 Tax=Ferrimonas balearica TaxID=44012 RepID=UPI001F2A5303|nr:Coenzyme F420 hydrogenase/dehydrogenase, beta subunit C-terminal domain [Ferrimonas balearica]MBY6018279.1 Coenzyme F420 hydrogenase/dehydrogenase, beta subunit C-terminal domain [Halomonas denitrificans]MBY6094619.1 Coenzyme F420 hydrogenase/dehydrogenase, beta subunit C-terminal domain [Ferrimonas balearica]